MIIRYYNDLANLFYKDKVLVILGPRQVGKTTLLKEYLKKTTLKHLYITGDDIRIRDALSSNNLDILRDFCDDYKVIVIDEASKIPNIGNNLKLIKDNIPNIQLIISSSSSFELSGQIGEPLTGRKIDIFLYPIAFLELKEIYSTFDMKNCLLRNVLVYGSYPEILEEKRLSRKRELLYQIVNTYLLKDILEFERVKNSKLLFDLLKLIAYQIGNEVSMNELSIILKIDHKTVSRYIDLLEKAYIIYNLRPYSTNLRKEIAKKSKYFFYDIGLRNAIISNLNPIEKRNDIGALFENFIMNERIKRNNYKKIHSNIYFWRIVRGKEVNLVEERNGNLYAYEMKYNPSRKVNKKFLHYYPNSEFRIINKDNFTDFII